MLADSARPFGATPPCVLIVDDDPELRRWFAGTVAVLEVATHLAATGVEGLALYQSARPHVVLLDLRMPDMSGLDVLRTMSPLRPDTECIVISGFANVAVAVEAMRLGATDVVEKPITDDKLLQIVSDALQRTSHARRQMTAVPHALRRWAELAAKAVTAGADVKTLRDWGRLSATSTGALRNWCRTAGLPPRKSLLLARMLRAVMLAQRDGLSPENSLDVADLRTLMAMLTAAGCRSADRECLPSVHEFLANQRFIKHDAAIAELVAALARDGQRFEAPLSSSTR